MKWSIATLLVLFVSENYRVLCNAQKSSSKSRVRQHARDEISYFKGDPGSLSENPNTFPDVIHTLQNTITSNLYPESRRQTDVEPVHPEEEENVQGDNRNSIERTQDERGEYPYTLVNDGRKREPGPPGFSPERVFNPQPIKRVKKVKETGPEAATYFGDNQEEEESPQQKLATLISKPIIHESMTGTRRQFSDSNDREYLNNSDERQFDDGRTDADQYGPENEERVEASNRMSEEDFRQMDGPHETARQFAQEEENNQGTPQEERAQYNDLTPKEASEEIVRQQGPPGVAEDDRRATFDKRTQIWSSAKSQNHKQPKSKINRSKKTKRTKTRKEYSSSAVQEKKTLKSKVKMEGDGKSPMFTLNRRRLWGNIEKRWRRSKVSKLLHPRSETSQSYDAYGSIGNVIGGDGGTPAFPPSDVASDNDEPTQTATDFINALNIKGKFQDAGITYKDEDESREFFHPVPKTNMDDESIEDQAREISEHPPTFTEAIQQLPPDVRKAINADAHASESFHFNGQDEKRGMKSARPAKRSKRVRPGNTGKKKGRRSLTEEAFRYGKRNRRAAAAKKVESNARIPKVAVSVANVSIPGTKRNRAEKVKNVRAKTRTYDTYEAGGLPDGRSTEHETGVLEDNEQGAFQNQMEHDTSPIIMKIAEHDREDMHKLWDNGHSPGNGFYTGHGEGPNRPYLGDYLNGEGVTTPEREHEEAHSLDDTADHHTENLIDAIWEHDMEDHHHGNGHGDKVLGYFGGHAKPEQNVLLPTETLDGIAGHWTGGMPHAHVEQFENEHNDDSDRYQFSPERVKAIQAIQDDPSIDAELQTLGEHAAFHEAEHGGHGVGLPLHTDHELHHEDHIHDVLHEALHEPIHEAVHEGMHEAMHEPIHEAIHEPMHEAMHEPMHDVLHHEHPSLAAGMDMTPAIEDSVGVEDSHEEEYKQHIDNIMHKYQGLEEHLKGMHGSLFDHLDAATLEHHNHNNYHSGVDMYAYKNPWDNMRLPYHVPVDNHPLNDKEEPHVLPPGFPGGKGDDKGGLLEGGKEEGGKGGPIQGEEKPPEKPPENESEKPPEKPTEKPPKKVPAEEKPPAEKPPDPKPPKPKDEDDKPKPLNRENQKEPDWGQLPLPVVPQQKSGVGNTSNGDSNKEDASYHSKEDTHEKNDASYSKEREGNNSKEEGSSREKEEASHSKEEGGSHDSGKESGGRESYSESHEKEGASHESEGKNGSKDDSHHEGEGAHHEEEGGHHEGAGNHESDSGSHEKEGAYNTDKEGANHYKEDAGGHGKEDEHSHYNDRDSSHEKEESSHSKEEGGPSSKEGDKSKEEHYKEEASQHGKEDSSDHGKEEDNGAGHGPPEKEKYADSTEKEGKMKDNSDNKMQGKQTASEDSKQSGEGSNGKDNKEDTNKDGVNQGQQLTSEQTQGATNQDSKSEGSPELSNLENAKVPNTIESQQLARLQQLSALQQTLLKSLAKQAFPLAGQGTGGVEGAQQTDSGPSALQQIASLQKLQQMSSHSTSDPVKDQQSSALLQYLHGLQQKVGSSSTGPTISAKESIGQSSISPSTKTDSTNEQSDQTTTGSDQSKLISISNRLKEMFGAAANQGGNALPSVEGQSVQGNGLQLDTQTMGNRLSFLQNEMKGHVDPTVSQTSKLKDNNGLATAFGNSIKQQLINSFSRFRKGRGRRRHHRHRQGTTAQQENAYSNIGFETVSSDSGVENSVKKEKYPNHGPLLASSEEQTGTSRESLPDGPREYESGNDGYSYSAEGRTPATVGNEAIRDDPSPMSHSGNEREYAMEDSSPPSAHDMYAEETSHKHENLQGDSSQEESSLRSEYGAPQGLPPEHGYVDRPYSEDGYHESRTDAIQGEKAAMMQEPYDNGVEDYAGVEKTKISRHDDEDITSKKSLIKAVKNPVKAQAKKASG